MSLPAWVEEMGPDIYKHDARLREALSIAWEALELARDACNDDYCCCSRGEKPHDTNYHREDIHCSGFYANEALTRIEEMGK